MDIFSKDNTIISDIINRILNCREIKDLYVFGESVEELECLYPAIHVIKGNTREDMTGEVVYIHIIDREELEQIIPWVMEEKETKDFIIYISSDTDISDEDMKMLGTPHYLDRYSGLTGVLFLTGVSFQSPRGLAVPDEFKVLAVIHFYNEADILERTIQYLLSQEIDLYLLDNWSDDGSYEIAERYQNDYPERIYLEQFPLSGKSENYEWYNQLEKTEKISKELNYDWFIHYDADEMRVSPWENVTLREAIYHIDRQGYNCIENTVIDFRFTKRDSGNIFMEDTFFDFRHDRKLFDQLKTWKKSQKVDLKSAAGHFVHITNPKAYPLKFLNRHYPLRSMEQAEKKVFQDRLPRFQKEHAERGWHGHYDSFKKAEDFIFERSQLLKWGKETFRELYIPLFLECGLRWDNNVSSAKIDLPNIENGKVIIYGAGNIGKIAYLELAEKNEIAAWVDKLYRQLPAMFCEKVTSPEEIQKLDYDYIILAVKKETLRQEITEELKNYCIAEEKLLYI
ncbi:MAG: glycosyltransferase [Lachnospiraceae bacterium]|nr:glycosyltransferase [Lachnospiraceae bacterium]